MTGFVFEHISRKSLADPESAVVSREWDARPGYAIATSMYRRDASGRHAHRMSTRVGIADLPAVSLLKLWRGVLVAVTMSLDSVLELSVEQLIKALNEKLFMECKRVQLTIPPISRGLVTKLTSEV